MRLVCVDESCQWQIEECFRVKKGVIYHALDEYIMPDGVIQVVKRMLGTLPKGCYYKLIEMPKTIGYHESLFVPIVENQIDETETKEEHPNYSFTFTLEQEQANQLKQKP